MRFLTLAPAGAASLAEPAAVPLRRLLRGKRK
jgi:hypothetical protein